MFDVAVNYAADAVSGEADVSCVGCGLHLRLPAGAADDSLMTAFVRDHGSCALQLGETCDACLEGGHACWTCEDEGNCHAAAVLAARYAAGAGSVDPAA